MFKRQCQNCEHSFEQPAGVIKSTRCLKDLSDHLPTEERACWVMPTDRKKLFEGRAA